jgi:hypothetical protein
VVLAARARCAHALANDHEEVALQVLEITLDIATSLSPPPVLKTVSIPRSKSRMRQQLVAAIVEELPRKHAPYESVQVREPARPPAARARGPSP